MSLLADQPALFAALCAVAGLLIGIALTWLALRSGPGRAAEAQIREEFEDYKEEVHEHFEKTAELFRDMTEKYRDVYEHLAEGAQSFGKDLEDAPALHIVPREQLPPSAPAPNPNPMPPDVASPQAETRIAAPDAPVKGPEKL